MKVTIEGEKVTAEAQTGEGTRDRWECRDAEQAERHIATWGDAQRPAAQRLSKGDASAVRDAAHELKKQRDS